LWPERREEEKKELAAKKKKRKKKHWSLLSFDFKRDPKKRRRETDEREIPTQ
jgi:hypothetical protein